MIVVLLAIVLVQTCVIIVLLDGVAFWRASYDSASLRGRRRAMGEIHRACERAHAPTLSPVPRFRTGPSQP